MSLALIIPGVGMGGGAGIAWTDRGRQINHVAANHAGRSHYLEAYFRAAVGTAHVRLYDDTDAAAVSDSQISTVSATDERVRSNEITLADGHDYIGQSGTLAADSGGLKAIVVVEITPGT